jgi:hypothetical protein
MAEMGETKAGRKFLHPFAENLFAFSTKSVSRSDRYLATSCAPSRTARSGPRRLVELPLNPGGFTVRLLVRDNSCFSFIVDGSYELNSVETRPDTKRKVGGRAFRQLVALVVLCYSLRTGLW